MKNISEMSKELLDIILITRKMCYLKVSVVEQKFFGLDNLQKHFMLNGSDKRNMSPCKMKNELSGYFCK